MTYELTFEEFVRLSEYWQEELLKQKREGRIAVETVSADLTRCRFRVVHT